MGLIEDNPMGMLIVTTLLAFAEFERDMISERCLSGKIIARTKTGFKEGRPFKYTPTMLEHALELLKTNSQVLFMNLIIITVFTAALSFLTLGIGFFFSSSENPSLLISFFAINPLKKSLLLSPFSCRKSKLTGRLLLM